MEREVSKELINILCDQSIYLIGEWDKCFTVGDIDDMAELFDIYTDTLLIFLMEEDYIYVDYDKWDEEIGINCKLHLTVREGIRIVPKLKIQIEQADDILSDCIMTDKG